MMLDLRNGTGQYDAFMVGAFWYGDIVPAGYSFQIDELMKSGKYPQWSYDEMSPSLRNLYTWEGKGYGVRNDADGQVLYYRASVLENPQYKADFKKQSGYEYAGAAQDLAAGAGHRASSSTARTGTATTPIPTAGWCCT